MNENEGIKYFIFELKKRKRFREFLKLKKKTAISMFLKFLEEKRCLEEYTNNFLDVNQDFRDVFDGSITHFLIYSFRWSKTDEGNFFLGQINSQWQDRLLGR